MPETLTTGLPPFGQDPMDKFSEVLQAEDLVTQNGSVVGHKITKLRRNQPEKPGRTLAVAADRRVETQPSYENNYLYLVRFRKTAGQAATPAGRHYHNFKNERFVAAQGDFLVVLEDRASKEQVRLTIHSDALDEGGNAIEEVVFVPAGIAHAVLPLDNGTSTLLVLADHAGIQADELAYEMDVS